MPEVGAFMAGFTRPWWVVGGWAVDAFTGHAREHSDVDISIFASDVPAHLGDRWHLWNLADGDMRPLTDNWGYGRMPTHRGRPTSRSLRTTTASGRTSSRPGTALPLVRVIWVADDGLRHLCPEIVLFFTARLRRTKDERDFQ